MKKQQTNNQGFTLIELLLASAIFAGILGTIILLGARSIEAQAKSRAMQGALDNARFAMEGLNKKIRTSNNIAFIGGTVNNFPTGASDLFVIDNLDGAHYCYMFANNKLYAAKEFSATPTSTSCSDFPAVGGASWRVIAGSSTVLVTGKFYVKTTELAGSNKRRGLVTTVIDMKYSVSSGKVFDEDKIKFQTTVSLRDYIF